MVIDYHCDSTSCCRYYLDWAADAGVLRWAFYRADRVGNNLTHVTNVRQ